MEEQCKIKILEYANEQMQRNAALLGEHEEYVNTVLTLLRDEYHKQVDAGKTTFTVPTEITNLLNSIKPW
jgi:hypothetical protein|tara:strand:+ start:281 stop:490 length:210 start_codon:yes stop_codon:yes gene_type:complete